MKSPIEVLKRPNLEERRAVLDAKLAELTMAFRDRSDLIIENSADILDTIRMATDREISVERMNISARIVCDIRDAIDSLNNGTYGICDDCEEPISGRRLEAIPWARVCVKCQEARDRSDADAFSEAA